MKLDNLQLLSKEPIYIPRVGGIISPTLNDIVAIGKDLYESYLNILAMNERESPRIGKVDLDIYSVLTSNTANINVLKDIFNFFIKEDVDYDNTNNIFTIKGFVVIKTQDEMTEQYTTIGTISKENYREVANVILKRNNVFISEIDEATNVKNKKALSIMQKLKNGREKMNRVGKVDINMELSNIISAVACEHKSLNLLNIWDLTIYQLWDTFARLVNNNVYHINAASVSTWGDKSKSFKFEDWYRNLKN